MRWGLRGPFWTAGLLVVALAATATAQQERRVALVIGNGDYDQGRLRNPVNDARAIAQALRRAGFEVIAKENADRVAMYEAINAFGDRLRETKGVGLFYFSGHGLQVQGKNFMVPLRARISSERMVETEAIDVNRVLGEMDAAQARVNIVILDACRDNPYARSFRSGSRGLAQIDAPRGTLIAYATAPGKVAEDGTGENSLYTGALVKHIEAGGVPIEAVFKRVRVDVLGGTGNRQEPWEASSLTGDFFFFPTGTVAAVRLPKPAQMTIREPPAWAKGDEWSFRWESPEGKGTFVWSIDREETLDGIPHYVIKTGTREIFYRKQDIATTKETVNGVVVLLNTPPRLRYVWPLFVGKTWEQSLREERPSERQTRELGIAATVEAEETVTVPAGTFETLKLVYRNKGTGAILWEEWYSPEVGQWVRVHERRETGRRVRELTAFSRKPESGK
jgi:hypothetical protein